MVRKRSVLFLSVIYSLQSFILCQAFITAESLLDFMSLPGVQKEYLMKELERLEGDTGEIERMLKFKPPCSDNSETAHTLMGHMLLKLPSKIKPSGNETSLSYDDILEISKYLWKLHPQCASSVIDSKDGQPLIHNLMDAYLDAHKNMPHTEGEIKETEETAFYRNFIDFIIVGYPRTLSVLDGRHRTVLHSIQPYAAEQPQLVNMFITNFLKAGVNINAQDKSKQTVLHAAQMRGAHPSTVQLLLDNRANPLIKDKEKRDVLQVILKDEVHDRKSEKPGVRTATNKEFFLTLLKNDTITPSYLVNLKGEEGKQLILHAIAKFGSKECIDILTAKGVNINHPSFHEQDAFGKTPYDYAKALTDKATSDALTTLLAPEKRSAVSAPLIYQQKKLTPSPSTQTGKPNSQALSVAPQAPSAIKPPPPVESQTPAVTKQSQKSNYTFWMMGGAALIALVGGAVWLTRKLKQKLSPSGKEESHVNEEASPVKEEKEYAVQ